MSVLKRFAVAVGMALTLLAPQARAAEPPENVLIAAEIGSLTGTTQKVEALIASIVPLPMGGPMSEELLGLTRTADTFSVNADAPVTWVWLADGDLGDPVLVFGVEDAERYLDGLPAGLEKLEGPGEIYLLGEAGADADAGLAPDEWDLVPAESFAVGVVGGKYVATARSVDAVTAVVGLMEAGALVPGQVAGEADAGAFVRVAALLAHLNASGQNPFVMARMMMGQAFAMQPNAAQDQQRMVFALLDGLDLLLGQLRAIEFRGTFGEQEILVETTASPVPDTALARYVAGTPTGAFVLPGYLPDDAVFSYVQKIGDVSDVVSWATEVMAAAAPPDTDPAAFDAIAELAREWAELAKGEAGFAAGFNPQGTLAITSANRVAETKTYAEFMARVSEQMPTLLGFQKAAGLNMDIQRIEDVPAYKGHEISGWRIGFEFTGAAAPPGGPMGPEQMAAMQQAMVEAIYGEDFRTYWTLIDDVFVQVQGDGALERLKAIIDKASGPAAGPGLGALLEGLPGEAVGAGSLAVEGLLGPYFQALGKGMAKAGIPVAPMLSAVRFAQGPPVTMATWVNDDGSVGKRVRVPVSMLRNVSQGFMMMAMQMMQQQGGQPRLP